MNNNKSPKWFRDRFFFVPRPHKAPSDVNQSTGTRVPVAHITSTPIQNQELRNEAPDPIRKENETATDAESAAETSKEQEYSTCLKEQERVMADLTTDLESAKQTLKKAEYVLEKERLEHENQIQAKDDKIGHLQFLLTEAASKTVEIPSQSLLRRPESEIIKDWQSLTYDVHNLVMNYVYGIKTKKMISWAKKQGDRLEELTPDYVRAAEKKDCGTNLVEAAVWNTLWKLVFGNAAVNGPMLWAGKHHGCLSRLSNELSNDIARARNSDQQNALFHEWKALTTSLISLVHPQQDRECNIMNIVRNLEDMLKSFQSTIAMPPSSPMLQNIVRKAVALDELFCGQQAWYRLLWPLAEQRGVELDLNTMKAVGGGEGKKGGALVMFTVQPCLCRGGHDSLVILDKHRVWMY
ncbi:hypothetical protein QQS21_005170 [Conoideocrella luteorostrata]|uniref:Uncharacterized protein n=1 Tax=Conoideocrella luteorostrata TaxID=1105319 RepID=A0AAJ0CSZ1_9HYPO|nr:hypothetical protein QQS21_005170 [Conoideocrella luteorostrata]